MYKFIPCLSCNSFLIYKEKQKICSKCNNLYILEKNEGIKYPKKIKRTIKEGANIIGYLYWSLMDNYEWQEGYNPDGKLGLYQIKHNTTEKSVDNIKYKRIKTNSVDFFKHFLYNHRNYIFTDEKLNEFENIYGTIDPEGSKII
ncbi:MAG: family 1 glycosylhydrolase [Nitrososphaeraceae archaeon]